MGIENLSKDASLEDFLKTCGIQKVTNKTFEEISKKVKNASTLRNLIEEGTLTYAIREIDGLDENTSNEIAMGFSNVDFMLDLEDAEDNGYKIFDDKTIYTIEEIAYSFAKNHIKNFKGKNVVITGTLSHTRDYFVDEITRHGGEVKSSVSKKTDILIYSTYDGMNTTKYNAAKKINDDAGYQKVVLFTETEFWDLVDRC